VYLGVRAGDEDALATCGDPLDNGGDLLGRLAGPENRLGEAPAQGAVVVHLGEAQVLVGEGGELHRRLLGGDGPLLHLLEQLLEASGIH
jgi:hypothetical protein